MKEMRKILASAMAALLLCGCGAYDAVQAGAGDLILLENRNPVYYEQFSPQSGFSFPVNDDIRSSGPTKNLILSGEHYMVHDGFTAVMQDDGSVTVSGQNSEKKVYIEIAKEVLLSAGDYVFSDGGTTDAEKGYYMWIVGGDDVIASTFSRKYFTLEEPAVVSVFIVADPGANLDKVIFYPEICLREDEDDVFDPYPAAVKGASGSGERALLFRADREAVKGMTDDERILFDNNLACMYRGRFEWVSILFEDGTGVQIPEGDPDKALYGKMDIFGRVWEKQ